MAPETLTCDRAGHSVLSPRCLSRCVGDSACQLCHRALVWKGAPWFSHQLLPLGVPSLQSRWSGWLSHLSSQASFLGFCLGIHSGWGSSYLSKQSPQSVHSPVPFPHRQAGWPLGKPPSLKHQRAWPLSLRGRSIQTPETPSILS